MSNRKCKTASKFEKETLNISSSPEYAECDHALLFFVKNGNEIARNEQKIKRHAYTATVFFAVVAVVFLFLTP